MKIIRQKVMPLNLSKKMDNSSIVVEEQLDKIGEIENIEEKMVIKIEGKGKGTRYIGIDNTDLEQRIQHAIRNLIELDNEELAYIEDMNCRNMFEIVLLLNKVVATLVENMMAMN